MVIEENSDPLENYLFCLVCVAAERKTTGKLGLFERELNSLEDTEPLPLFEIGLFSTTWSSWPTKFSVHEQNRVKELLCSFISPLGGQDEF